MKKLLLCLSCMATINLANAQYGQRVYFAGGAVKESFNDGLYSTVNLNGGLPTYVATGISDSTGNLYTRFTRMASGGATIANRHYSVFGGGVKMNNYANAIAKSPNRCIMTGEIRANTVFPLPGFSDVLVLRTNANGNLNSAAAIDINNGLDVGKHAINSTFQPNRFFLAGNTRQNNNRNAFLMKIVNNGTVVNWTRAYNLTCSSGLASETYATSIVEEPGTGSIFVVGYTTDLNASATCDNAFISKFLNNGTHVYTIVYSDASTAGLGMRFESIKSIPGMPGNYMIVGNALRPTATPPNGIFNHSPIFLTVNLAGAAPVIGLLQQYGVSTFAGALDDARATDVTTRVNFSTGMREYFISGGHTINFMPKQGFILKLDQTAGIMATMSYGNTQDDELNAIEAVGNGGFAGNGLTAYGTFMPVPAPPGPKCYWVKSYYNLVSGCHENPVLSFVMPITLNTQTFIPTFITNTSVMVLPHAQTNDLQNTQCWAVNLPGGSNLKAGVLQDAISLNLQVYPNPTTNDQNINISLVALKDEMVTVTVYDTKGALQYTANEVVSAGTFTMQLPTQKLNSGLYLIRLEGNSIHAQKSFIIK